MLEELEIIKEQKTDLQTMRFYETPDKRLMFTLNTFCQFIEGEAEQVYHYNLTKSMPKKAKNILILGGGDGLAARNILQMNPSAHIDLVELDKGVADMFSNDMRLTRLNNNSLSKCNLFYEDATEWVKTAMLRYHFIILDLPDGTGPTLKKLYTKEFYADCVRLLKPGGVISIQSNHYIRFQLAQKLDELLGNSEIIDYSVAEFGDGAIVTGKK